MDQQKIIDNLNIEKIALDQSYVKEIQANLELRKQHLLKDKYIQELNDQIQKLLKEKNDLSKEPVGSHDCAPAASIEL
jgi:hypothetical protein